MYLIPTTPYEWWKLVDDNWYSVYSILERFLSLKGKIDLQGQELPYTLGTKILMLHDAYDKELVVYLEEALYNVQRSNIRTTYIAGWRRFEDLCSSSNVLWEGLDDNKSKDRH